MNAIFRPLHRPLGLVITATAALCLTTSVTAAASDLSTSIPAHFPRFSVAEHPAEAAALRHLFWHHSAHTGPVATLWDEWLLPPSLWPAHQSDQRRAQWRKALLERSIDPDGYVATHQHGSIAHQRGWPFPGWHQSPTGFGWHFSFDNTIGPPWRAEHVTAPGDWTTTGVATGGVEKTGWAFTLDAPGAVAAPPAINASSREAPFIQIRWQAERLVDTATPFIEWTSAASPQFSPENRMYFEPATDAMTFTMVPLYRHPGWRDHQITGLRLNFDNETTGAKIILQGLFAQFDTRHNVNNPAYVSACIDYFHWTRDLNFLRQNIERMRLAMRFMEMEFGTDKDGLVKMPWVGHEGTSGFHTVDGKRQMRGGYGVGNNYWDLVPFGQTDSYATIRHYSAALKMADLEEELAVNPGWNIPPSPLAHPADHWRQQAQMAKENGNKLFWNDETGRFTLGPDAEGNQADFGFTFLNLEAIAYDFATPEHAAAIFDWLDGRRRVATDTAQTTDIYHWRFAPRATTRRNTDHYGWFWPGAASIPFGDQVQDGGAVLGFSYHDIIARLKTHGPDDAAARLMEIARWYQEVTDAGGYRQYYDGKSRPGTLQGGGTAGGLGLDKEFFESVMVPQTLLDGFLGFRPTATGCNITPRIPTAWPSLTVTDVRLHEHTFTIEATSTTLCLIPQKSAATPIQIQLPDGWRNADDAPAAIETHAFNWDGRQRACFQFIPEKEKTP